MIYIYRRSFIRITSYILKREEFSVDFTIVLLKMYVFFNDINIIHVFVLANCPFSCTK